VVGVGSAVGVVCPGGVVGVVGLLDFACAVVCVVSVAGVVRVASVVRVDGVVAAAMVSSLVVARPQETTSKATASINIPVMYRRVCFMAPTSCR
jgi:hypothetical protein